MPVPRADAAYDNGVLPPGYRWFVTGDGSPSLVHPGTDRPDEGMHNAAGAFAETMHVYHPAIAHARAAGWPLHVVCVGLGLAYNEIVLAADHLAAAADTGPTITSFESEPWLRSAFVDWLARPNAATPLRRAYSAVTNTAAAAFASDPAAIPATLGGWMQAERIRLAPALTLQSAREAARSSPPATVILYDAYSSRTSPDLWSEAFLVGFLDAIAADHAVFATYAATGALKRALLRTGFTVHRRPGFGGKREMTFAVRGY